MSQFLEIEDVRKAAAKRIPRMFYDYIDTGSWTQSTYRENTRAFEDIRLRQRVGVNMARRSLETRILGQTYALPRFRQSRSTLRRGSHPHFAPHSHPWQRQRKAVDRGVRRRPSPIPDRWRV